MTEQAPHRPDDKELDRICSENVGSVQADSLTLSREAEGAYVHVVETYKAVLKLGSEPCRALLPDYTALVGEVMRLWPLPAAPERCRSAWKKLEHAGMLMRAGEAPKATRQLQAFRERLPALRKATYKIDRDTLVGDAMLGHRDALDVFRAHDLRCHGCAVASREKIADAAVCHPFDEARLLAELNALGTEERG